MTHNDNKLIIESFEDLKIENLMWIWKNFIPAGKLTLLAGQAGCGKTNICLSIISILSNNSQFPDNSKSEFQDVESIFISVEDDMSDTIKPRLIANNADLKRIKYIKATVKNHKTQTFDIVNDLKLIEKSLHEFTNLKLIVIDPIVCLVKGDLNKATDVRNSLQFLIDFASKYNIAIVGISHLNKSINTENQINNIIGSQAFVALARQVLIARFSSNYTKDILELEVVKSNICKTSNVLQYKLETHFITNTKINNNEEFNEIIETVKIKWLDTKNITMIEEISQEKQAVNFLRKLFETDKSLELDFIRSMHENEHFSYSTLKRAKNLLNIKSLKRNNTDFWMIEV